MSGVTTSTDRAAIDAADKTSVDFDLVCEYKNNFHSPDLNSENVLLKAERCHDWRNHIPEFISEMWCELHDVHSNANLNVTHRKKHFENVFGTQKELFFDMIDSMIDYGYDVHVPKEVLDAI